MDDEKSDTNVEEMIEVDLNSLCRICGNVNLTLVPIYENEGLDYEISQKINEYLPICIAEDDLLPTKLCPNCCTAITFWHQFVTYCQLADRRFQLMLQQSLTISENDAHIDKDIEQIQEDHEIEENKDDESIFMEADQPEDYLDDIEYLHDTEKEFAPEDEEYDNDEVKEECVNKELPKLEMDEEKPNKLSPAINQQRRCSNRSPAEPAVENASTKDLPNIPVLKFKFKESIEIKDILPAEAAVENASTKDLPNIPVLKVKLEESIEIKDILSKIKKTLTIKNGCYTCDQCETFKTRFKRKMKKHLTIHYDSNVLELAKASNRKIKDEDKYCFECPECKKQLYSSNTFAWHLRIHTGERPHVCYICGKNFRVIQGLSRHIKETHEKIKEHGCDICGKYFTTLRNLSEHSNLHTNKRPYVCDICGKDFKQKASLYIHKRMHEPVLLKCECGLGFRSKSSLKTHSTVHTGEKPHECEICKRQFRIKHELNLHKLTHFDEKPFECEKCGQRFKQKRYLARHKKNHGHDEYF